MKILEGLDITNEEIDQWLLNASSRKSLDCDLPTQRSSGRRRWRTVAAMLNAVMTFLRLNQSRGHGDKQRVDCSGGL